MTTKTTSRVAAPSRGCGSSCSLSAAVATRSTSRSHADAASCSIAGALRAPYARVRAVAAHATNGDANCLEGAALRASWRGRALLAGASRRVRDACPHGHARERGDGAPVGGHRRGRVARPRAPLLARRRERQARRGAARARARGGDRLAKVGTGARPRATSSAVAQPGSGVWRACSRVLGASRRVKCQSNLYQSNRGRSSSSSLGPDLNRRAILLEREDEPDDGTARGRGLRRPPRAPRSARGPPRRSSR